RARTDSRGTGVRRPARRARAAARRCGAETSAPRAAAGGPGRNPHAEAWCALRTIRAARSFLVCLQSIGHGGDARVVAHDAVQLLADALGRGAILEIADDDPPHAAAAAEIGAAHARLEAVLAQGPADLTRPRLGRRRQHEQRILPVGLL